MQLSRRLTYALWGDLREHMKDAREWESEGEYANARDELDSAIEIANELKSRFNAILDCKVICGTQRST